MLIPSIDLMGGKIVQLVQGEKKALEFETFADWTRRFARYPVVQLVDLDAAKGDGNNRTLIEEFCRKLPCQVGGGIRTALDAEKILKYGAKKVIVGSALISWSDSSPTGAVNVAFAEELFRQFGQERLVFALDARGGKVSIHGWQTITDIAPETMMLQLEPFAATFLYTHIDTEGLLGGIPMEVIRGLRQRTSRRLIAAGGIRSNAEIEELDRMGVDAVVGMAIYSGLLKL